MYANNIVYVDVNTCGTNDTLDAGTCGSNDPIEVRASEIIIVDQTPPTPLIIDPESRDTGLNKDENPLLKDPKGICLSALCCVSCWVGIYFGITCSCC